MGRQKRLSVVPLACTVLGAQLGQIRQVGQVRQVRQAAQAEEGEEEKQAQEEETEARQEEELQEQSRGAAVAGGGPVLQEVSLLVPLIFTPAPPPPPLVHPEDVPVALLLQVLHLHPVAIQREVVLALQERFSLQAALVHPIQISIRVTDQV